MAAVIPPSALPLLERPATGLAEDLGEDDRLLQGRQVEVRQEFHGVFRRRFRGTGRGRHGTPVPRDGAHLRRRLRRGGLLLRPARRRPRLPPWPGLGRAVLDEADLLEEALDVLRGGAPGLFFLLALLVRIARLLGRLPRGRR
jgi:hypothetical protein